MFEPPYGCMCGRVWEQAVWWDGARWGLRCEMWGEVRWGEDAKTNYVTTLAKYPPLLRRGGLRKMRILEQIFHNSHRHLPDARFLNSSVCSFVKFLNFHPSRNETPIFLNNIFLCSKMGVDEACLIHTLFFVRNNTEIGLRFFFEAKTPPSPKNRFASWDFVALRKV